MTTACEFYADAVVERAAGVLDPERASWLDAHLASCAECAAALRTVSALHASPLPVPDGLEARLRTAVRAAAGQPGDTRAARGAFHWRAWALPLAAAAAAGGVWIASEAFGPGSDGGGETPLVAFEEYDPYGAWPAGGVFVAGQAALSELSTEELEHLLTEMET
jgi:anti-sigma factor RsiW